MSEEKPEELLKFPTDYPIKVMGRPSPEFRARIHAIVVRHVPNVEIDRITERLSENGNFLSISYVIVAESREQVIALAHSGRRGTEGNIVRETISCLQETFDTQPENLIVQLGPCIRPPHYEIDFAAEIERQARACGVRQYHDCGMCTASHLDRYYSYRAEKGKTGRMWAVFMIE